MRPTFARALGPTRMAAAGLALVIAGCSGASSAPSSDAPAAEAPTAATPVATPAPTVASTPDPPTPEPVTVTKGVDLTLSGGLSAKITGSTGYISSSSAMDGTWQGCSVNFTGADYPSIGGANDFFSLDVAAGSMDQWSGKTMIAPDGFYTGLGTPATGVTFDPATKTVTIERLSLQKGQGDPTLDISGTITCP